MHELIDKKTNILFVHYGDDWIRGSERCLLDLISHLDQAAFNPVVWCNSQVLANHFQDLGIKVIRNDFCILFGWKAPRFNLSAYHGQIKAGIKIVKEFNIDIIHANSGAPNQWLAPVSRITTTPLIAHLHSPYLFRDRMTLGIYQATKIVGVSKAVVHSFIDDGVSPDKISVIYNGIDCQRLNKGKEVNSDLGDLIPTSEITLATVGSLIHRKGVDMILQALKYVLDEGIRATLLIIGDGEERDALENLAAQLAISDRVIFLGERDDVQAILRNKADIFISAAREEAFGLVLAEAGLAKLPTIAPCTGGIPEVIENDQTGLLFPPGNIDKLVNRIRYLYTNHNERGRLGKNAYACVRQRFSIQENVRQFENLYRKTLRENVKRCDPSKYSSWAHSPSIVALSRYLRVKLSQRISNYSGRI